MGNLKMVGGVAWALRCDGFFFLQFLPSPWLEENCHGIIFSAQLNYLLGNFVADPHTEIILVTFYCEEVSAGPNTQWRVGMHTSTGAIIFARVKSLALPLLIQLSTKPIKGKEPSGASYSPLGPYQGPDLAR
jgi:hypothetical protein